MIKVSDYEWKIMNLLWDESPLTITEMTKLLHDGTSWSKHTVITYLKRMEEKGFIRHEQGKKAKLFYPVLDQKEAIFQEETHYLDKVFRGNAWLMVNTMVTNNRLTPAERDQLMTLLTEMELEDDDEEND